MDPDSDEARLARHRDLHRTVHPDVVAGNRAAAAREQAQREDIVRGAVLELTAGLDYVQNIVTTQRYEVSYETMQRANFKRKTGWWRKYTLADARSQARTAEIRLSNAWELLDPINPAKQAEAQRTALGNCQESLQQAVAHLSKVLNGCRSADEQLKADTAAREWLQSVGAE